VFAPNEIEVTGVGSRRYLARVDGNRTITVPTTIHPVAQSVFLLLLTMALGSNTGTTEGKLPTASIEATATNNGTHVGNLYNMLKLRNLSLAYEWGQPLTMEAEFMGQAVQETDVPQTYTGFQNISIGGYQPLAADAKPYSFANMERPTVDYGSGPVQLPSVGDWRLAIENTLVEVPGAVVGADTVTYPWPECIAEEGQTITVEATITPRTLEIYKRMLARTHRITSMVVAINHPVGSGGFAKTTLTLQNGGWVLGDFTLEELVLMRQPLRATFQSVVMASVV